MSVCLESAHLYLHEHPAAKMLPPACPGIQGSIILMVGDQTLIMMRFALIKSSR